MDETAELMENKKWIAIYIKYKKYVCRSGTSQTHADADLSSSWPAEKVLRRIAHTQFAVNAENPVTSQ
jgi:hypothetical protein